MFVGSESLFLIYKLSDLTNLGKGMLRPMSNAMYMLLLEILGFSCGKYMSQSSMSSQRLSGISMGGGRSSMDSYLLRLSEDAKVWILLWKLHHEFFEGIVDHCHRANQGPWGLEVARMPKKHMASCHLELFPH